MTSRTRKPPQSTTGLLACRRWFSAVQTTSSVQTRTSSGLSGPSLKLSSIFQPIGREGQRGAPHDAYNPGRSAPFRPLRDADVQKVLVSVHRMYTMASVRRQPHRELADRAADEHPHDSVHGAPLGADPLRGRVRPHRDGKPVCPFSDGEQDFALLARAKMPQTFTPKRR